MKGSQALAFISGRDFVIPDDVQYLAPFVFSHRMILKSEAKYQGASTEDDRRKYYCEDACSR